jgi:radical SAM superfamily enzyme YgiQ (UPF0313 family)
VNKSPSPAPLVALRSRRPKRRLVLVALDWTRENDPRVPLGHASLLAALRRSGADVSSLTIPLNAPGTTFETVFTRIAAALAATAPADLGVGAYVWNESYLQRLLPALRAAGYRGRIILGGPQISYQRTALESIYPDADIFVRGYGEQVLVELLACDKPRPIPGVHWAGDDDLGEQARVQLDELASPFLTGIVDVPRNHRFLRWETQRGCPYRCSFCQHSEADARPVRRRFGVDRIDDEIRLFTRHEVRSIAVLDPVFNLGEHPYDVLDRLRHYRYTGRLSLQCHSDAMREPERFLRASAADLDVHLEFGLQTIHDAEMHAVQRRQNLDRFATIVDMLHRERRSFEVSVIYGLPEQTLASFLETVRWCLRRRIPVIRAYPLVLLRGTQLSAERARWGLREDGSTIPAVVESSTFDRADWHAMAAIADALRRTESHHPVHLAPLEHMARGAQPAPILHAPAPA